MPTIKILSVVGAPQATKEQYILTRSERKRKKKTRELVSQTHDCLILRVDNLSDFTGFDENLVKDSYQTVADQKHNWWEIHYFPESMYGDCGKALYMIMISKTDAEKDKNRRDNLKFIWCKIKEDGIRHPLWFYFLC